ncbi:hypothetical protein O4H66_17370 [Comamonadaceae bacterium G21597-S1]|nr:hypothetical protein [Comamonadaceae bacterium G21597-S1]
MIPLPLLLALGILLASNAAAGWAWLKARDQVAELRVQYNQAANTAGLCSRSIEQIRVRADQQTAAARTAVAAAAAKARAGDRRADQILATPPSKPDNDCASAQAQVDEWLSNRAAKP